MDCSCPICFDTFDKTIRATTDVCDHIFCFPCLHKWSKHGNFCPVDRKKFKKIINLDSETATKVKPRKRKVARAFYDITAYCEVCKNSSHANTLLLCDSCDLGYHCDCLTPPLKVIPNGRWHCPECVAVELRLRTNIATPADTKYAKNVRKKKRKKLRKKQNIRQKNKTCRSTRKVASLAAGKIQRCLRDGKQIFKENGLDSNNTTNAKDSNQPGPSKATTSSASNFSSYSLENFKIDFDCFSTDDEENTSRENNAHQQEQSSKATTTVNSCILDNFDLNPDVDLIGFSTDDEEDASRDMRSEQLPPADESSISSEDSFFRHFNFDVSSTDSEENQDVKYADSTQQDPFFDFENSFEISDSDFETSSSSEASPKKSKPHVNSGNYGDGLNKNEVEVRIQLRDDVSPQIKTVFNGDFNDLSFKDKMKDVNTSKDNVDLLQEQTAVEDSATSSSEGSSSMQCGEIPENDLCQEEQDNTEETSRSSLNSAFSDYPEAIVLKLPLQLSLKRSTATSTTVDSSGHSSSDAIVKNISSVSANFCKITRVTSCPVSLFQNLGSESNMLSNQNEDANKTNNFPQDTSTISKDNQVDDMSNIIHHNSNTIPIIFSLIEKKHSKLTQPQRMYSYESFMSSKDSDPSFGKTHFAAISKTGGTSSPAVENLEVSTGNFGQGNVFQHNPITDTNKISPSKTFVRNEFCLYAEESGKVTVPPNLSCLFKRHVFRKDIKSLSARKDGALFLNWKKHTF